MSYHEALVKFAIKACAEIAQVDVLRTKLPYNLERRRSRMAKTLTWMVRLCVIYVCCRLALCTVYQYYYDQQIKRYIATQRDILKRTKIEEILAAYNQLKLQAFKLQSSSIQLKRVGSPFMNLHFLVEPIYLFLITAAFLYGLVFPAWYNWSRAINGGILCAILDPESEKRRNLDQLQRELDRFEVSSENFAQIQFQETQHFIHHDYSSVLLSRINIIEEQSENPFKNQQLYLNQLRHLAEAGKFEPSNRKPDYIMKVIKNIFSYLLGYSLVNMCISLSVIFALTYIPEMKIYIPEVTNTMDLVALFEIIFINVLLLIAVLFFIILGLFTAADQIYYTQVVKRTINSCYLENESILCNLKPNEHPSHHLPSRFNSFPYLTGKISTNLYRINIKLLYTMIQYKLAVSDIGEAKAHLGIGLALCSLSVISSPILLKIFVQDLVEKFVSIVVLLNMILAAWLLTSWVYICHMNGRSKELNKALFRLIAHIAEWRQRITGVYEAHTLVYLGKEITGAHRLNYESSASIFGIGFTYTSLLRFYFYFGIILMSAVYIHDSKGPTLIGLL